MTQLTHHHFQGIIRTDQAVYTNWGQSRSTQPAVYLEPISYQDVQIAVANPEYFPSPIHPVGSMLSVTSTITNDGGSLICTRKLDHIVGLEVDAEKRQVVRVQAGCRLKKLNTWLQSQGLEVAFQAEIGEATVGSVSVGDTKESSINAPGYFSAHVTEITYVNAHGKLVTLSDRNDADEFHAFKCSYGLLGIVVECVIEVRPASLCRTDVSLFVASSPEELANMLLGKQASCDALLAIVMLQHLAAFCEIRYLVGPGTSTPESSQPSCNEYRLAKRLAIQYGFDGVEVPQPSGLIHARSDFVNEYWRPTATEKRLDFQYYEHDISQFTRVLITSYQFTKDFETATGFAPKGWATYFVKRLEKAKKPYGLYSGGPGISFSFDPFCSNPLDPDWQIFSKEYNQLAIHQLKGNASPIQTQWLETGDISIPQQLTHPRFLTSYYAQFVK